MKTKHLLFATLAVLVTGTVWLLQQRSSSALPEPGSMNASPVLCGGSKPACVRPLLPAGKQVTGLPLTAEVLWKKTSEVPALAA
ncbi:MAG: hypothetical protein JNG86_04075, partial [Verrucomicrobiaceae bacterium]|nr:hypothetical protein [Verrucomicrobiaceae bacterium]